MGIILEFPKDKILYPERVCKDQDEVARINEENITFLQETHVNDTIEALIPIIFRYLMAAGFDLSSTNNIKEGAFFIEALRSSLLQLNDIHHPFQKLSEEVFESAGEDMLKIVAKLNIVLEEPEEELVKN